LAHAAKAKKRLDTERVPELVKIDDRAPLGVLQWHAIDGTVRRWVIKQGPRANNLRVTAKGKEVITGWDHLLTSLRKHLALPRRQLR
jgi:hypothetical protein